MYEAFALSHRIAALLNGAEVGDRGADFRITVTDTAGSIAEVAYEAAAGTWRAHIDCFDRLTLFGRLHEGPDLLNWPDRDQCGLCRGDASGTFEAWLQREALPPDERAAELY